MLKNAFISKIMGDTIKMNRGIEVKLFSVKFISGFVIKILDKEYDYRIVDMGAWRVKGQNLKARSEQKINARFVLGIYELVEKHSSPNILTHFQYAKKLQFSPKKVHFKQGCNFHINTKQLL